MGTSQYCTKLKLEVPLFILSFSQYRNVLAFFTEFLPQSLSSWTVLYQVLLHPMLTAQVQNRYPSRT